MGKLRFFVLCMLLAGLIVSLVSADTLFSQTKTLYNLGENIDVTVKVKPNSGINGFLELGLDCGEVREFYRQYLSLSAGEEKEISTSFPLSDFFVADTGACRLVSVFGSETSYSQEFEVSDRIDVDVAVDNDNPAPGSEIIVSGTAVKENGKDVEGFVDIMIKNTDIKLAGVVTNGKFSVKLLIPEDQRAGVYPVNAYVYEKIDDKVSNNGEVNSIISVQSIPKSIEVAVSSTEIIPGESIKYTPIIIDQAGDKVKDIEINVIIYNSNSRVFAEKVSMSGNDEEIEFETSTLPGIWKISAEAAGLKGEKEITILELEKAEISLENNTLIVTNIGNVIYRKSLEIDIGGETEIFNVEVPIRTTKKFKLYAPEGIYDLKISDGVNEIEESDVLLTGRAIKIVDASESIPFARSVVIWLFIFVVLGLFIYNKYSSIMPHAKKYEVSDVSMQEPKPVSVQVPENKKEKKYSEIALPDRVIPRTAEHTIVLKGTKQHSSLVTLNVKNSDKINLFKALLNDIAKTIIDNKGAIYQSNNFLIAILAPVITKTFKNEVSAIKLAGEIDEKLKTYNQKTKEKIDYGLIVHSGELVVDKTKDTLKFTATGNALSLSKKLTDSANNEYLISENAYQKAMSDIKADKEVRNGFNLYRVNRIVDKEAADKFIREFLNRQKQK